MYLLHPSSRAPAQLQLRKRVFCHTLSKLQPRTEFNTSVRATCADSGALQRRHRQTWGTSQWQTVGCRARKRIFSAFVAGGEGINVLVKVKLKGAGPERRGGGRSEKRTVCKLLSFSTRRPPPYSSLPPNPPKWHPELQSMPSSQLASLARSIPLTSSVSCNFPNSWQG